MTACSVTSHHKPSSLSRLQGTFPSPGRRGIFTIPVGDIKILNGGGDGTIPKYKMPEIWGKFGFHRDISEVMQHLDILHQDRMEEKNLEGRIKMFTEEITTAFYANFLKKAEENVFNFSSTLTFVSMTCKERVKERWKV